MTETARSFYALNGKTCVVTGAASGIGRAVAVAFAREGAQVATLDLDSAGSEGTRAQIESAGGCALALSCDVSDAASVSATESVITDAFGPADILVNCAAIQRRGAMEDLKHDDWDLTFDVNLKGYFLTSQIFGRAMLARGTGVLVHVSSVQAMYPSPGAGAYSATKSGIVTLSKQLALEWGPRGVRSNVVEPAWVHTPFSASRYADPMFMQDRVSKVPLGRIGSPEDIAEAVLFLASSRASYISGTELLVDGALHSNFMGQSTTD